MKLLASLRAHIWLVLAELLRIPAFVVPTIAFPAMFFALFTMQYARSNAAAADFMMLSYVAFAVIGVTLFQFGVGVSSERGRPWERYLRTLPVPVTARFAARIVAALLFGAAAAGLLAVVARLFTPIDFSLQQWLLAALYAVIGGVPFVLFGLAVGYWCNARAALPITNLLYLLLSYAGGLWMPPQYLPHVVQEISVYLPTRQFAELLWSVARPGDAASALAWLAAYAAIFAAIASFGYRRDERTRYA
jgi:ABC-2 type transport system permease protein